MGRFDPQSERFQAKAEALAADLALRGLAVEASLLEKVMRGHDRLLQLRTVSLAARVVELASSFGVSPQVFMDKALKAPAILYRRPESVVKRIEELARYFGVEEGEMARRVLRQFLSVQALTVATVERNLRAVSAVLGIGYSPYKIAAGRDLQLAGVTEAQARRRVAEWQELGFSALSIGRLAARRPSIVRRAGVAAWVSGMTAALRVDTQRIVALVVKTPGLTSQKPATLLANVARLAVLLSVSPGALERAALSFPPLFYLAPERVAARVGVLAEGLRISGEEVAEAILRMPSLFVHDPRRLLWRARLLSRIATHRGEELTTVEIVRGWPAALVYGHERLLGCYLIAKHDLARRSWRSLLVLRRSQITTLIDDWSARCPDRERVTSWRARWVRRGVVA